jgi:hemolysin activation/secretion protein
VIKRIDARWHHKWRPGHVLVLSAFGMGGKDAPRDFQVVVGGLNGLRAYSVQALAGNELVRLNAEQRWILVRNRWDLISVGMAAFYDAARAWGPGAVGTGWFNAAGFGMRFSTPRSALGPVIRLDVAWPISPTRDGSREAVFTFGSSQAF